jgi:hypothetical protein
MIYGILSSGSVHLTEISRSLEEDITMYKTHDRLCRNLGSDELEDNDNKAGKDEFVTVTEIKTKE